MFKKLLNQLIKSPFETKKHVSGNASLPEDIIDAYYRSRNNTTPKFLCHAPFNNMYFNSLGHVANCWLTFHDPEVYTAEKSIMEIWNSEKFIRLRQHIKNFDLDYKCSTCKQNLLNKNFVNVLARAYDNENPLTDYPGLMEFELSNTCNLECTMCTGLLSSSIRRNREKLAPLVSPYGEKFVRELEEFIPHLYEARFNGGEPFLIKEYWNIWESIVRLNPKLKVVIATNGTVLNEKVKDILNRGNFHLNISMDGLSSDTYNSIRVNSKIDRFIENFMWFKEFCAGNNRTLCIMVNPMRQNWWEMADFVDFCNEHNVHIWYNTIERPLNQAIWNLPAEKIEEIYNTLLKAQLKPNTRLSKNIYQYNVSTYNNLVQNQIYNWLLDAREREKNTIQNSADEKKEYLAKLIAHINNAEYTDLDRENIISKVKLLEQTFKSEEMQSSFRKLIQNSPPAAIANNLKSHPFEEARKLLMEYLDGSSH